MSNAGELWILRAATSTEKCGRRRRDPAPSRRARRPRRPPGSCPCAGSHPRGDGVLSPRRYSDAERRRRGGGDSVATPDAGNPRGGAPPPVTARGARAGSDAGGGERRRRGSDAGRGEKRRQGSDAGGGERRRRGSDAGRGEKRGRGPDAGRVERGRRVAPRRDRGAAYRRARGSRSPSCPKGQPRAGSQDRRRGADRLALAPGRSDAAAAVARGRRRGARTSGPALGREAPRRGGWQFRTARPRGEERSDGWHFPRGRSAEGRRHARRRAGRCARGAGDGIQQDP